VTRDALYLARKDLAQMFRLGTTWLWAFLMPVLFFYFIGSSTGGFSRPRPQVDRIGFYSPPDAGFLVDQFRLRLEGLGYTVERVSAEEALRNYSRRLVVPANFTEDVLAGRRSQIRFAQTGGGLSAIYDEFRIKRAAYTVLADVLLAAKDGAPPTAARMEQLTSAERAITVSVAPAGKRQIAPSGFQQSVPGTMVMFLLLVMFTTGGASLFQERNMGILRRLASAPVSRGAIVLGKGLSRFALGLIQTAFGMIAGTVLFRVDWGTHLAAVILLLMSYGALAAVAGMLLANFGKTGGQVIGLGVLLSNLLGMIGGCWWPAEITPLWAQKLGMMVPTGWAMNGLHRLMSFGDPPLAVAAHIAGMLACTIVLGWILARRFRFN